MRREGGLMFSCAGEVYLTNVLEDTLASYKAGIDVDNNGVIRVGGLVEVSIKPELESFSTEFDCGETEKEAFVKGYSISISNVKTKMEIKNMLEGGSMVTRPATYHHGGGSVTRFKGKSKLPYLQVIVVNRSRHGSYAGDGGCYAWIFPRCQASDLEGLSMKNKDFASGGFTLEASLSEHAFDVTAGATGATKERLFYIEEDMANSVAVTHPFTSLAPNLTA